MGKYAFLRPTGRGSDQHYSSQGPVDTAQTDKTGSEHMIQTDSVQRETGQGNEVQTGSRQAVPESFLKGPL